MDRRSEIDNERFYRPAPRSPMGYRAEESFERRRPGRSPSPGRRVHTEELIERRSPAPAFLEEERLRRERDARGVLVRRQDLERRQDSPSAPPLPRGILRRGRSVSPSRDSEISERIRREEIIEQRSQRGRSRTRSPSIESRLRNRFHDRRRSLDEHERIETKIVERERRVARSPSSSRSSSPSPRPPVVRGPTIERDVITHYHDVDHGVTPARVPHFNHVAPPSARARSRSRERRAPRFASELDLLSPGFDELRITDTTIDDHHGREHEHTVSQTSHRRAQSAAPLSPGDREEAEYITNRVDSRGRMGEAKNGITKDWSILDVPPGTERVRMDGAGGAGVDVDWTQYSGVRRTRFVPDRDRDRDDDGEDELFIQRTSTTTDISPSPPPRMEKEREVHIEKVTDRRILRAGPPMPAPPRRPDMWTEITKDLVSREALDALRYDYEETDWHFYVMQYLQYEDVLELIEMSDDLKRRRRDRAATWDRVGRWEREHKVRPPRGLGFEEVDRVVEKKVYYDRPGVRYR